MSLPHSLGHLEQLVLLAVLRLDDAAYGVAVTDELAAVGGRSVTRATTYATLQRLEDKGLVSSTLGEPTPERGGRAKRYYRVSAAGKAALGDALRSIDRLAQGLESRLEAWTR